MKRGQKGREEPEARLDMLARYLRFAYSPVFKGVPDSAGHLHLFVHHPRGGPGDSHLLRALARLQVPLHYYAGQTAGRQVAHFDEPPGHHQR
jgi:hypothetical protein